ncbi:MAG: 2Fe-2S iron-sulfur cluster binding domain-containing protein [Alphaproteobacteria bacterium]|nr:2Fe-2S iron-sulfur cluster binding domain-containing protein [Alphaproteobacteria bacterium]
MLDLVVQAAALLFLVTLAAYAAILVVARTQASAVMVRAADAESQFLRVKVDQIMDRRRFETSRSELSWNGFRKFEIVRKQQEGGGICSFYLQPHDKKPLPPFHPGQYLTFQLPIPGQRKPVIRCYSLSDSPHHPDYYRVSIKKLPPPRDKPDVPSGLSSSYFHDQLDEGDIIDVKAPSGHFHLDMAASDPVVLIGGGVGITPVLSMLAAICESGANREVWFFYGVRNGREHIMKAALQRFAADHANVRLYVCYSDPEPDEKPGEDFQQPGRISVDWMKTVLPSNNYKFYLCGPPPFMESLVSGLKSWSVPESDIHFEAFGPATVKRSPAAQAAVEATSGSQIQVTFAKSGKSVPWSSEAGSLLEFAEENGVVIDFGCRAGNCGTCLTAIKAGDVNYVNPPGSPPEAGSCLTCISVPKVNLTLDA